MSSLHLVFEYGRPLPETRYGGTERVIYALMKALIELGHKVTLISPPPGDLIQKEGIGWINRETREQWTDLIPSNADLLHLSSHPKSLEIPVLVTQHGHPKEGEVLHPNTVFISKKHASLYGSNTFVYNGIDLSEYPFLPKKLNQNHFLFLGKGRWAVKNLKGCIEAIKKTDHDLHIAGGRAFSSLWNPHIHSYGIVDQKKKIQLLQQCDALLFPVRWHEPFGLAIIEAMAMGLPVFGSPYGSLPELISPETGVIVHNQSQLIEAIESSYPFDSVTIRKFVETHFNSLLMAKRYVELYKKILNGISLHSQSITVSKVSTQELLPF
ncbi:MAG: hypothetical protein CL678_07060 [Bdellovibrionaceae bacterium]|nr:hypothetical protein [Pseudobdellovibrionaceae bacterium]|tara:strand:+ start:936 stop:1910 length:975 start_codon:yes stop_codon:yes gene_type:complete